MKKSILLFLIIVSIHYNLKAQIALTGNITTAGVAVYPTHIDSLGRGGFMTIPDLTTRNTIPVKRRKQGMLVYVQANDSLYKLSTTDVSLNTGWLAMGLLTQQKFTDSLNTRLKTTDTLSLSNRINLKADVGTISDLTNALGAKLNITDTLLFLQKADTASLSNRINLKANISDFNTLTTSVGTKFKTTDTSYLLQKVDTASLSNRINLKANTIDLNNLNTSVGTKFKTTDTSYLLQKADTATLSNRINLKIDASKIGVRNGVASLNASGVIPSDQIPPISFSSVDVVNSQAEMLSFTNGTGLASDRLVGSIVVRIDSSKNFVLARQPASIRSNWTELLTPAPPVQSVNGRLGTVMVTPLDLYLDSVDNTRDIDKPISNLTKNALTLKLKITDTSYLLQKADTASLSNRINLKANTTDLNTLTTTAGTKLKITDTSYLLQKRDTLSLSNRILSNLSSITAETTRATAAETTLTNRVNSNTSSITSNISAINTINTNISSNTASISSLNTTINSNTASITSNTADILLRATILSPSFTGTPTATTAPALTNTTQLATTAFVRTAVTNTTGLTNTNLSGNAGITDANLATISTEGKVSNSATSATASNTSYSIVSRDALGDFSANNITANLNGTAINAVNLMGGTAGSIPYQTASNTTGLLPAGTSGQLLTTTGSGTLTWTSNVVPYTDANRSVNLGAYDLTVNGITVGKGVGAITSNTVIGNGLSNSNNAGVNNTALGFNALKSNTTGVSNTANGVSSLFSNTTGSFNSAYGVSALYFNNSGYYNSAIGMSTLLTNTTGNHNTAIGNKANVGSSNLENATAIGDSAIVTASNTVQLGNINVNNVNTSGTLTAGAVTYPRAHGTNGQILSTTGSGTLTWTTATNNLVPFNGANRSVDLGYYDLKVSGVTVGRGPGTLNFANTTLGDSALAFNASGSRNNAFGNNALQNNTNGNDNIAFGTSALAANTTSSNNIAIGTQALGVNIPGSYNVAIGSYALAKDSIGSNNTAIGYASLRSNTTGINNTATGMFSLISDTSGSNNTANGYQSLNYNSNGSYNTANGVQSLYFNSIGIQNTSSGVQSLYYNTSGNYNNANGYQALNSNTTGAYNTAIGKSSLSSNTTGNHNTAIGNKADVSTNNLENATAIGDSAIVTASNTIQLGNSNVTNVKTNGTLTANAVTYPNSHGTNGQFLTTTGTGILTWTTLNDASATSKGIIQLAGDLTGIATSPTVNTVGGVNSSTISTFDTRINL